MSRVCKYPISPSLRKKLSSIGVSEKLYRQRLYAGWSQKRASSTPIDKKFALVSKKYIVSYSNSQGVCRTKCFLGSKKVADFLSERLGYKVTKNAIIGRFYRKKRPITFGKYTLKKSSEDLNG